MVKLGAILAATLLALAAVGVAVAVAVGVTGSSGGRRPAVHRLSPATATASATATATTVAQSSRAPTGRPRIPETRISIVSRDAPTKSGVARVRLSCQMGEAIMLTCRGLLSLQSLVSGGGSGAPLGSARFAIPNCCSAPWHVVSVRLNQAGRRLAGTSAVQVRARAVLDKNAASATGIVRLLGAG